MPPFYTHIGSVYGGYPTINSHRVISGLGSEVVLGFINAVENEINAKLAGRYSLPFSNGCPVVATIALRETIYRLCLERSLVSFPPAAQGKHPLAVAHAEDQKFLEAIMSGKISLADNSLAVISPSTTDRGEVFSTTMNQNPTFHEGDILDAVQDTDKLDTIESERQGRGL